MRRKYRCFILLSLMQACCSPNHVCINFVHLYLIRSLTSHQMYYVERKCNKYFIKHKMLTIDNIEYIDNLTRTSSESYCVVEVHVHQVQSIKDEWRIFKLLNASILTRSHTLNWHEDISSVWTTTQTVPITINEDVVAATKTLRCDGSGALSELQLTIDHSDLMNTLNGCIDTHGRQPRTPVTVEQCARSWHM